MALTYPTLVAVQGSGWRRIVELTATQRGLSDAYLQAHAVLRAHELMRHPMPVPRTK